MLKQGRVTVALVIGAALGLVAGSALTAEAQRAPRRPSANSLAATVITAPGATWTPRAGDIVVVDEPGSPSAYWWYEWRLPAVTFPSTGNPSMRMVSAEFTVQVPSGAALGVVAQRPGDSYAPSCSVTLSFAALVDGAVWGDASPPAWALGWDAPVTTRDSIAETFPVSIATFLNFPARDLQLVPAIRVYCGNPQGGQLELQGASSAIRVSDFRFVTGTVGK